MKTLLLLVRVSDLCMDQLFIGKFVGNFWGSFMYYILPQHGYTDAENYFVIDWSDLMIARVIDILSFANAFVDVKMNTMLVAFHRHFLMLLLIEIIHKYFCQSRICCR